MRAVEAFDGRAVCLGIFADPELVASGVDGLKMDWRGRVNRDEAKVLDGIARENCHGRHKGSHSGTYTEILHTEWIDV